jgi:hypothetical protein
MIIVAAVALALGVEATRRRWRSASSAHLALAEACWRKAYEASERAGQLARALHSDEAPEVAREQRRADRWGEQMEAHRRAARYPWLPIAPDSTGPEQAR